MSLSSLEKQFKDAGVVVKRGVKIRAEDGNRTVTQTASDIWLYRWARNSYKNYERVTYARGVVKLADTAVGVPSIIVGIGPSLDAAMPAIKHVDKRAIIISTDAAFRPLMANGIAPDLVISFDCKPEQSLLWGSVPYHGVPCLFDTCAHPDAIASWVGPVIFYNHWHQADELSKLILPHVYPHIGQIPSGGTVGNMALILSRILGCKPTLAVGMDFCYAKTETGWRYRSTDYLRTSSGWIPQDIKSLYDNDERVSRSFMRQVNGAEYRMDPELEFYHKSFVAFITSFGIETINCSPEGALKDVCATMPLDAALDRFCPIAIDTSKAPFFTALREAGS